MIRCCYCRGFAKYIWWDGGYHHPVCLTCYPKAAKDCGGDAGVVGVGWVEDIQMNDDGLSGDDCFKAIFGCRPEEFKVVTRELLWCNFFGERQRVLRVKTESPTCHSSVDIAVPDDYEIAP